MSITNAGGIRYDFAGNDSEVAAANSHRLDQRSFNDACDFLRNDVVGCDTVIRTPFGSRKLLYADYTASGRSLKSIEEYVQREVLPYYGNTHTLSSATGSQTTFFRIEARQIVKQYLNATYEDALIFCGSGSTAAVQKFISIMQRSLWDLKSSPYSQYSVGSSARDDFFQEDRWGSCECRLCGVRLKNENLYRAHQYSDGHQRRLKDVVTSKADVRIQSPKSAPHVDTPDTKTVITQRLVVFFCDPTAHHSSSLPFRELVKLPLVKHGISVSFDLVELRIDASTCRFDHKHLENELINCKQLEQKAQQIQDVLNSDDHKIYNFEVIPIAILSAGSNVTGLQVNVAGVTELVHHYGGITCWDFAAVSAHTKIDFNPSDRPNAALDVGFFSPHKLVGGPGCPGMLVIKKTFLRNAVPAVAGGGVVFFVSHDHQSYIHNAEEREEGGTPDILADIRVGLVYRLHSQLSPHHIAMKEFGSVQYLLRFWGRHKRIQLLGPLAISPAPVTPEEHLHARMGIISFMIKYGNNLTELSAPDTNKQPGGVPRQISVRGGLYLHHNFVVALLNDLFGIQVRGGCLCAGPLAQFILGLDEQQTREFEECLERTGQEVFRPGVVRASVHYSMNHDDIELLCQAVLWIADFGWRFLPAYTFVPETGEWEHRVVKPNANRRWLSGLSLVRKSGVGMTAVVDGRMGQQGHSGPVEEKLAVVLPKKDPRRIAGAVALLPGASDGDQDAFKSNLKAALTGLKKAAVSRPSELNAPPVSELQALLQRRSSKATTGPKETTPPLAEEPSKFEVLPMQEMVPSETEHKNPSTNKKKQSAIPRMSNAMRHAHGTASFETPAVEPTVPNLPVVPAVPNVPNVPAAAHGVTVERTEPSGLETLFISETLPLDLETLMAANHDLLQTIYAGPRKSVLTHQSSTVPPLPLNYTHLLWFALPIDATKSLLDADPRPRLSNEGLLLLPSTSESITSMTPDRPISSSFEVRTFSDDSSPSPLPAPGLSNSEQKNIDGIRDILAGLQKFSQTDLQNPDSTWGLLDVLKTELLAARSKQSLPEVEQMSNSGSPIVQDLSTKDEGKEGPKRERDGRLEIPRTLRRTVGSAIRDFDMIREGDRLLVGLSGGKDSLTLLHALRDAQKRSPVKFELFAATVDPQTPEYDPSPLVKYVESLGITYHFLSYPLIELAKIHMQKNSICAFCSRMKRGILYSCMRKYGYNVLVLGQHLDDICESFVMSAFHNGSLNTMKANYTIGKGDIRVCRPLIYTREKVLANFAKESNLPVIADNCPACFSQPKERHRVKILLAQQEFEFPHVFQTLLQTVKPLISIGEVDDISKSWNNDGEEADDAIDHLTRQLVNDERIQNTEANDLEAEGMLSSCVGRCPKV